MSKRTQHEIRQELTQKVVELMEKGVMPWRKCWKTSGPNFPVNFFTNKSYRGINPVLLLVSSIVDDFHSKYWGTFRQWSDEGFNVRKGSKGTEVVFFSKIIKEDEENEEKKKGFLILRTYTVFNFNQIQKPDLESLKDFQLQELAKKLKIKDKNNLKKSINEKLDAKIEKLNPKNHILSEFNDFSPAEEVIKQTGANIVHRGNKACYNAEKDTIYMPSKQSFEHEGHYYETVFHELIHWSESRIDAKRSKKLEESYGFYELVAELGAVFICAKLNVPYFETMLEKNVSYLNHWLIQIKENPQFLFSASNLASKAVDFILKEEENETT